MVPSNPQVHSMEKPQVLSLSNIFMIDGLWTSGAQFSRCGWIWMNSMGKVQLMGTRNFICRESALHSKLEALRWAIENMIQYSTYHSFETNCKDLTAMIKEPETWPNFATKLERMEILQICFINFKITHIPRALNQIVDSLPRTTKSDNSVLLVVLFQSDYPNHF